MAESRQITGPGTDEGLPTTHIADTNPLHLALIIIAGIFATTLPQPQVLGKLPLQHILKNELHVTRDQMATFFLVCGLFWYLKPFAGILTDAFPLFRTRRRHYLLISSALAAVSWVGMQFLPHTYDALLMGSIIVNLFMVIASTVTGAYLVESGQRLGATGRLTALRQGVSNVCTLVSGPIAGFLASGAFARTSWTNAAFVFSVFPIAYLFLRERKLKERDTHVFHNAKEQLRIIGRSRNLWFGLIFIALFYFSPGLGTVVYYKQTDELKFTDQFIGNLGVFSGGFGILSAILYSRLIKRISIRTMLVVGIACYGIFNLAYLFYNNATMAEIIESQNGFFTGLAEVALIDLAARSTPKGCEGLGYSLILSIRNLAIFSADKLSASLADKKWPYQNLVFLNSGTTLLVLLLIPFLPAALLSQQDGERLA